MAPDTLTRTWTVSGLGKLQQALGEVFTVVDLLPMEGKIERGSTKIRQRRYGALTFTKKEGQASYRAQSVRKDTASDSLCLVFTENGHVEISTRKKDIVCQGQTLVLMDFSNRLESIRNASVHSLLAVSIPKAYLKSAYRDIEDSCFSIARSDAGWGAILRDTLVRIWHEPMFFNADEAQRLPHLLMSLIGNVFISDSGDDRSRKLDKFNNYIHRIEQIVDENISSDRLTPSFIAKKIGVSSSYIYSILRQKGLTPGQLIMQRRIDHCVKLLSIPSLRDRSITDIAFGAGFKDLSHFSRTFSRTVGKSPRSFRSEICATLEPGENPASSCKLPGFSILAT